MVMKLQTNYDLSNGYKGIQIRAWQPGWSMYSDSQYNVKSLEQAFDLIRKKEGAWFQQWEVKDRSDYYMI